MVEEACAAVITAKAFDLDARDAMRFGLPKVWLCGIEVDIHSYPGLRPLN